MVLLANPTLKAYGRPGESGDEFQRRCIDLADDKADIESAKLRDKYDGQVDRAELALVKAEDRLRELEEAADAKKNDELLSGAGSLLGALLSGKGKGLAGRLARGLGGAGRRRSRTSQARQRISTAKNRIDEAGAKIYDLEEKLEGDLRDIGDKWMDIANKIESLEVGLEKVDIAVDEVVLAWLPVD